MATVAEQPKPEAAVAGRIFTWPRLRVALAVSIIPFLAMLHSWTTGPHTLILRTTMLAFMGVLAFGVLERWPRQLPGWLPRWVAQVAGVALVMPLTMLVFYVGITPSGAPPFWKIQERLVGFGGLSFLGVLLAPWVALIALLRQKDVMVRDQALKLDLQRSEFERLASESRLRLLQTQVQPHFLFNTLANIRELVQAGSPQAPAVLESLIGYLRAAVPSLHEPATTLGQELQLVRAYLEIMHMRMPDRLQFELYADDAALTLRCPPMTLLTLVENAVRHGIDPSEEGGRIEVRVEVRDGRCRAQVRDTGVGLGPSRDGLGTGLATLRERLQLVFGGDAQLRLVPLQPHGATAEIEFPASVIPRSAATRDLVRDPSLRSG
jgi:hypothetical protein